MAAFNHRVAPLLRNYAYPRGYAPIMEIDTTATNWNVVELHVAVVGQEDIPFGEREALMTRTFDRGGYTYAQARDIVEALLRAHSLTTQEAEENARLWRGTQDAVSATMDPYAWAIFQHGETPRDGVEAVMDLSEVAEKIEVQMWRNGPMR